MTIRLLLLAAVITAILGTVLLILTSRPDLPSGQTLNELAWQQSFTERGQTPPPSGPREGFWGSRIDPKTYHPILEWHEPKITDPGILEIDANGIQHSLSSHPHPHEILIVGGSVAFGAYASSASKTYFSVLGQLLDTANLGSNIHVSGSGGWNSTKDLIAADLFSQLYNPDLIIILDGLNDLMFEPSTEPQPVSTNNPDYRPRTMRYLTNLGQIAQAAASRQTKLLFVLQPALFNRHRPTAIESKLLSDTLASLHQSLPDLKSSYATISTALASLADNQSVYFLDASALFANETHTTFTDMWHFADPGHYLLGQAIFAKVQAILTSQP